MTPKLRRLAQEALRIDRLGLRLHAAKAKRLVDAGVAVMLNGRCIVTIPARDGLMRPNAKSAHNGDEESINMHAGQS